MEENKKKKINEIRQRIIRNLEWANKRLSLQGKELDEVQMEIIEFCMIHDLSEYL